MKFMTAFPYLTLARIDSWPKNLILLLGIFLAHVLSGAPLHVLEIILALLAVCLASSANYVLNEFLDASTDAHHPIKMHRASVKNTLNKKIIVCEYIGFLSTALWLAHFVNAEIVTWLIVYAVCAWAYNIPPVRFKDKAYLDVILESVNYPIRVLLGWFCVLPGEFPPSSIIIIMWSVGAFTMSLKRLAEIQLFKSKKIAKQYRKSYATYTTDSLTISSFVYALFTVFGATILLLKYKIELILVIPALITLLAWYFLMGLQKRAFIIYPERLLGNVFFIGLCVAILGLSIVSFHVNIPILHTLTIPLDFSK